MYRTAWVKVWGIARPLMIFTAARVELITDGGPENDNHLVNSFVERQDISMKRLTALVDIDFFAFTRSYSSFSPGLSDLYSFRA